MRNFGRLVSFGLLATLLGVSGCATHQLDESLRGLIGQPVSVAVAHLGYPDAEREVMGTKIYVWSSSHQGVMPMPSTSTTTGYVGGAPVYGQTTGTTWVPLNAQCSIQLAVDADGTIKQYQWRGNQPGCRSYARMLRR